MSRHRRAAQGFTLLELIVVLAVLTILAGAATPMARLLVDGAGRDAVLADLAAVADALEAHYYDEGGFPATLTAAGFYGRHLVPGVEDDVVHDSWGGNVEYLYALSADPDEALVWSRGPNGADDRGLVDDLVARVPGAVPGNRKTRERMRVIVEALANFLETGGTLSGDWPTDRAALGLGALYEHDGFGTPFSLDAATLELRSAGADRLAGSADDLTS